MMRYARSARRYAKALFILADEQDRLEAVATDLSDLRALCDASPEFRQLVENPVIPGERRSAILKDLLSGRADPLTLHFMLFLVDKGRIDQFHMMADLFEEQHLERRGILKARIESAVPLTRTQEKAIQTRLGRRFGKTIRTETEVRRDLVGGFRIRIGDILHDYSLRTQLEQLQKQWINA